MKPNESLPPAEWLTRIFAGAHVAIGISRLADGRFVAVNRAFEKLFGQRRKEIIGRTSIELGHWVDPEDRNRLIGKLRAGEQVNSFELRYRKRSGEIGNMMVSAQIHDLGGEPYLVGQLTDVTERKRALRDAEENQARLDAILKLSHVLVFHQDRRLRYTWVANPVLGVRADDVLGRTDTQILGPTAARPLNAIKRRVLRTGRGERQEAWVTNNGRTGCFDFIVEPERAADGRITGLICAAADITRRKRAEERLQLQADILDALEEGVNLVDRTGYIRYTNPKFDAMFGYAVGELLGQPVAVLNAPGWDTPEATARSIQRALDRHGSWSGEIKNRRKDGSEFWTRAHIVATDHPKLGPAWISVQADISDLRAAQAERDGAHRTIVGLADHLQQQLEEQRRELAREVHDEIGATLTGIRLHLDTLAHRARSGEVDDIRVLVDRALTSTRALCSQLRPPMLDDLGLADTLRWYARDWAQRSGISTRLRIAAPKEEPPDALCIDLFRMLQELLTNVARHAGASHVAVTLSGGRKGLTLRVSDDGHGLPPEGEGGGYGLLGIRERLRHHGGTMEVASSRQGTTVTLHIPALPT